MPKQPKCLADKFPGVLEVRKSSGDYGIMFLVPMRYVEHIKPMLEKEGQSFAVFARPVESLEEADELVKSKEWAEGEARGQGDKGTKEQGKGNGFVSLADMASRFDMSERRVQQLEQEGVFVKAGHDRYSLVESAFGWIKVLTQRAKSSSLNQKREENIEKKNRELDRVHAVEMGKLVPAADVQRAREMENANIRQKFLYLKALAPQLEGRTVNEIEKRLDEYGRKSLGELDRSDKGTRGQGDKGMESEQIARPKEPGQRKKKKK